MDVQGSEPPRPRLQTAWVVLGIALVLLAYALAPVLLLVFAGLIVAVGLDGVAAGVVRHTPVPRWLALLATAAVLIGAIAAFVVVLVPQLVGQFGQMADTVESIVRAALARIARSGVTPEVLNDAATPQDLAGVAGTVMGHVARWGMTTLGALASVVVVVVIAGFAVADPALYRRGVLRMLPARMRPPVDDALSSVARALRWWFLSQLVSMLLLGVTVSAGLWLIGIELWLGLAVLTALLTFVPYLGPLIASVPILAVAFADGVETGLMVTAFYLTVQIVEGDIVVPWIQHKVVRLAPVVAIAAQVLFGLLLGAPGFILAAPLTVVGMVLVQKLWIEGMLRDTP
jgi:predicted PurR-regulated permease PerM